MNFKQVAESEAQFRKDGNALGQAYELTPFSIAIPGDANLQLEGTTVRPKNGFTGYFYNEKHTKEKVVLHFTVGHLRGDILSLSSESRGHVSTSFVLARDGMVYQLFSSAAWSYHLGRDAQGGNGAQSKISIGIEISNYGPLIKKGNNLETVYSTDARKDIYCSLDDTEQYVKLDKAFRGYQYYTAYTNEQYHNLILLLRYLTAIYKIPREFVSEAQRFTTSAANSANFKGIVSHVNYRSDKYDIGPAFDWARVINGVTAATYGGNPLEDAVAKAEQAVAAAKANVETAAAALTKAEADLAAAKDALEMSAVATRDANVLNAEPELELSRGVIEAGRTYSEDGPEPFDINLSPFYI